MKFVFLSFINFINLIRNLIRKIIILIRNSNFFLYFCDHSYLYISFLKKNLHTKFTFHFLNIYIYIEILTYIFTYLWFPSHENIILSATEIKKRYKINIQLINKNIKKYNICKCINIICFITLYVYV